MSPGEGKIDGGSPIPGSEISSDPGCVRSGASLDDGPGSSSCAGRFKEPTGPVAEPLWGLRSWAGHLGETVASRNQSSTAFASEYLPCQAHTSKDIYPNMQCLKGLSKSLFVSVSNILIILLQAS